MRVCVSRCSAWCGTRGTPPPSGQSSTRPAGLGRISEKKKIWWLTLKIKKCGGSSGWFAYTTLDGVLQHLPLTAEFRFEATVLYYILVRWTVVYTIVSSFLC